MTTLGLAAPLVTSEIAPLREVIVHRPGIELDRLTPGNAGELLFDDVLWGARARAEHEVFVDVLEQRGIVVHEFADLLAEAIEAPGGRDYVLDRVVTSERFGLPLRRELRALFADTDAAGLAMHLIGGVVKADLLPLSNHGLVSQVWQTEDFVLAPLPNTLFQRDNAAWIGPGVSVNPMAKPARVRESINTLTVVHHHPRFRGLDIPVFLGDEEAPIERTATLEGGDVHVIAPGTLLIGMGERTSAAGVERLARGVFGAGAAHRILAVELPRARSAMHLDTILTMIDHATFVAYPNLDIDGLRCWLVTADPDGPGVIAEPRFGVAAALAEALGVERVRLLNAEEDARAAEREQWNDADNYLAVAPGVVVGYDRNVVTNTMLRRHGIEVLEIPSSELSRGRGGARCMSCPVRRDELTPRP